MIIRKAENEDIPRLVLNREAFLRDVSNCAEAPGDFIASLEGFLRAGMDDGSVAVWLAEENGGIASVGYICYYRVAPSYSNPSGVVAYIQNIYTLPEYRRLGLASEIVRKLIEDSGARGCTKLTLHATAAGRPVYEKIGFGAREGEMELRIKTV